MNSFGGPWTQEKLEILRRYLDAYTTALKNQPFRLIYVDAFAGSGSRQTRASYDSEDYADLHAVIDVSPRIALETVNKPFDRLVFIEKHTRRYESLRRLGEEFPQRSIDFLNEDANVVLPQFCDSMGNLDRAVVFLDPFATEVSWETIAILASTRRVDCWILFPLGAVARMMSIDNFPEQDLAIRLDRVFGGREHWQDFYRVALQQSMFDTVPRQEREQGSAQIAEELVSNVVEIASRWFSTSSDDGLLGAHRQLG